jgi:hypothetical protein
MQVRRPALAALLVVALAALDRFALHGTRAQSSALDAPVSAEPRRATAAIEGASVEVSAGGTARMEWR